LLQETREPALAEAFAIGFEMALDADGINRDVARLQPVKQLEQRGAAALAAWRVMLEAEIGEEQDRPWIGRARCVERQVDIALGHRLGPDIVGPHAVGAPLIGFDRLVHDIPLGDPAGIATHNGIDIARQQRAALPRIANLQRCFKPGRVGGMPHQRVTAHAHAMLLREGHDLVRAAEIISARPRLGRLPLQFIFLDHHIRLARDSGGESRILAQLPGFDGAAEMPAGFARPRRQAG
jgi:hypothetical protein